MEAATTSEGRLRFDVVASAFVLVACAATVLWAAFAVVVDHYDGYEYIMCARTLWGDADHMMPKNPAFISLLGVIHAPLHWMKRPPELAYYHVPLAVLSLGLAAAYAQWARRTASDTGELPFVSAAAVCCGSVYFMLYAPFALSDVTVGFIVALWWFVDARYPLGSRAGTWARAAALALCATGRLQTILIPLTSLAFQVLRNPPVSPTPSRMQRAGSATLIIVVAALAYIAATGVFFTIAYKEATGFAEGVKGNFGFLRYYFTWISGSAISPIWHQTVNVFRMLTPLGVALAAGGLAALWARRREVPAGIPGTLIGSAVYFAFVSWMGVFGPQYLGALLPAWVLLHCFALTWILRRWQAWGTCFAGALILALGAWSLVAAMNHYRHPDLREDVERRVARQIAAWSVSKHAVFLFDFIGSFDGAPLPQGVQLRQVPGVSYYSGTMPMRLYTNIQQITIPPPPHPFGEFGFPIPDRFRELAPAGTTIVVPPLRVAMPDGTERETPTYALRWWPHESGAASSRPCDPRVKDVCVEVYQPAR